MKKHTQNKKCLVLDLDNTLWGGMAGEDGLSGIHLGFESPGSFYLAFQQAVADLFQSGIILAINSRNNPADAWEIINNHPNMILKKNYFAAFRINWNYKAANMIALAKELNIGLDAMVFLDDDPVQRALVRSSLSDVAVPEMPEHPTEYASFLTNLPYFTRTATTDEDAMRGNFYITERLRRKAEEAQTLKDEFLLNLKLTISCSEDDDACVPRLAQLSERTNQFNVNKHSLTEKEILGFIRSPEHAVFHCSARDVFGDYGVIGFALVNKQPHVWRIESFLMSCRALGRGIEESFLEAVAERARASGVRRLEISFVSTERNVPARQFVSAYFKNNTLDVENVGMLAVPQWITRVWTT